MAAFDARLTRLGLRVRARLAGLAVLGGVVALLVVGQAWLIADGIDAVFVRHRGTRALMPTLLALGAVAGARALLSGLTTLVAGGTADTMKSLLRRQIMVRLLTDPAGPAAARLPSGRLIALVTRGLDGLDGYVGRYLPQLVLAATVPGVAGVAIARVDWLSAAIVAVTLPLVVVFMVLIGLATREHTQARWRTLERLAHHYADTLSGLTTLQVFGRARAQLTGLARTNEAHRRQTMAALRWAFCSALVLELVASLSVALVAVAIGLRVLSGAMDLRSAFFVLLLTPEIYLAVRRVGTYYHDSSDGVAACDEAFAILDLPARAAPPEPPGIGARLPARTARLHLLDLHLTYPGRDRPALAGLTLTVDAGETLALVGPSGCGKSTVLSLLTGLREPDHGRVLADGIDLHASSPARLAEWRRGLAWLPQRSVLVDGTVGDNVALGTPGIERDDVCAALVAVGAGDLLPERPVGENGSSLSAGQRRRVGLARVLVRCQVGGARLVLLDEPTAALDPATEACALHGLLERLRALPGHPATVLMVAHRPSLMAAADRIVALPDPAVRRPSSAGPARLCTPAGLRG